MSEYDRYGIANLFKGRSPAPFEIVIVRKGLETGSFPNRNGAYRFQCWMQRRIDVVMTVHGDVCYYRVAVPVWVDNIETVEEGFLVSMSLQFGRQLCIVQPMVFIQPLFDSYLVYFSIVLVGRPGYMLGCKIKFATYS